MCRLLESIKVQEGRCYNLSYHERRMHRAQQELLGRITIARLSDQIVVPAFAKQGTYKCRVLYRETIEQVEFIPYQYRTIRTLKRVYCDTIEYNHKYEDRRELNRLFAQRGDCDDVLIIKNGLVTDTSYANVIFYDGQRWVTPAHPLLRGTQRQYLLDRGIVKEAPLREKDLDNFQQVQIINAFHKAEPFSDVTLFIE